MSIWFLRHLKTENNDLDMISGRSSTKLLPGQTVIVPGDAPEIFDVVYCSSSERCRETIADLGCKELICTDELLERNMGILEGMKRSDAVECFPELFVGRKVDVDAVISGGESIARVRERLLPAAERMLQRSEGENVLVCSHNQTLKVLMALFRNIEITNDYWQNTNIPNGKIIRIT